MEEVIEAVLYEGRVLTLVAVLILHVYGREQCGAAAVQLALQEAVVKDVAHLAHGGSDGGIHLALLGDDV